jgi:hypothetical protein
MTSVLYGNLVNRPFRNVEDKSYSGDAAHILSDVSAGSAINTLHNLFKGDIMHFETSTNSFVSNVMALYGTLIKSTYSILISPFIMAFKSFSKKFSSDSRRSSVSQSSLSGNESVHSSRFEPEGDYDLPSNSEYWQCYLDLQRFAEKAIFYSILWGVGGQSVCDITFRREFSDFLMSLCNFGPEELARNLKIRKSKQARGDDRKTKGLDYYNLLDFLGVNSHGISAADMEGTCFDYFINTETLEWENLINYYENNFVCSIPDKMEGSYMNAKHEKLGNVWKNEKIHKSRHEEDDDDEDSRHSHDASIETQSERSGGSKGGKSGLSHSSQYALGRGMIESDPLAVSSSIEDVKWTYRRYAPYMHVMALYRRSGRPYLLGYNDLYISRQIIKCVPQLPFTMISNAMDIAKNDMLNLECALLSHTSAFSVWRHINQATELLQQPVTDVSRYDDSPYANDLNHYSNPPYSQFQQNESRLSISHRTDSHNIPISSSQFYARAVGGQSVNSLVISNQLHRASVTTHSTASQRKSDLLAVSKRACCSSQINSMNSSLISDSTCNVRPSADSAFGSGTDSSASIVTNIVFELFPPVSMQALEVLRMFIEKKQYLSLSGQAKILEVPEGMSSCLTINRSYLNLLPSRLSRHVARLTLLDGNPYDYYRICYDYYGILKKNFSFNLIHDDENKDISFPLSVPSTPSLVVPGLSEDVCPIIRYTNDLVLRLLDRVPMLTFSVYHLITFREESSLESREVKARLNYIFPAFAKFPINDRHVFKVLKNFAGIVGQELKKLNISIQFFSVEWVKCVRVIFGDRLSRLESISFDVILYFTFIITSFFLAQPICMCL